MAKGTPHGVSGGVWPGYVAAVAGLVQSLLFVSSVVATVVYLLGILGSQQPAPEVARVAEGPPPVAPPPVAPPRASKPGPDTRAVQTQPAPLSAEPARWEWPQGHLLPNARAPLVLDYPAKQIEVDEQSRQRLDTALDAWFKAGSGQWRIVGHYLPTHELSARRAYFRLQLLRNQLIDLGVDPRVIDLRVLPAQGERLGEHQVVVMAAPVAPRGAP